jgi:integrase
MKICTARYPRTTQPDQGHRAEAGRSRVADRSATMVADYLPAWLAARQTLRPSTRLAYEIHLRRYLIPHLGHLELARLSLADIEAMYTAIAARERPVGAATMHRIHATLVNALGNAARRGLIASNPAQLVELPRTRYPRLHVWSAAQLAEFLTATAVDRVQPLFLLLALTGLRRGKAIGLRWSDVDLERRQLHVEQQLSTIARQSARTMAAPNGSISAGAGSATTARRSHRITPTGSMLNQ